MFFIFWMLQPYEMQSNEYFYTRYNTFPPLFRKVYFEVVKQLLDFSEFFPNTKITCSCHINLNQYGIFLSQYQNSNQFIAT